MKVFFDKIEFYRKQKKMTEKGFCELCKIGRSTYWSWKNQKHAPDEAKVRTIAKILGVSVSNISDLPREYDIADSAYNKSTQETASNWLMSLYENNSSYSIESIKKQLAGIKNNINNSFVIIKAIMQSIHEIFYIKDINLKYVIVNEAFLNNLSLDKNYNTIGKSDIDFFPIKEAKANEKEDREILLTAKAIVNKEKLIPGSKKKKWGMASKYPILSTGEKAIGIIAMFSDITAQKAANEKRILLETAIDNLEDTYVSIGKWGNKNDYVYEYVNLSLKQLFSLEKTEEYKNIPKLFTEMVTDEFRKVFEERKKTTHFPAQFLYKAIKPDGAMIWAQDSVYKFGDKYISIVRDITEMREAEAARVFLEKSINTLDLCIWNGKRVNGKFIGTFISDSVVTFSGIEKKEFLKNPEELWLRCVHKNDVEFIHKRAMEITEFPTCVEYRLVNQKDNSIRHVREHVNKFGNNYIGIIEDISENKYFEKKKNLLNFCMNNITSGFAIIDIGSRKFEYMNDSFANIFNSSVEEMHKYSAGEWYVKFLHYGDRVKNLTWDEIKKSKKIKEARIITQDNIIRKVYIKTDIKRYNKKMYIIITIDIMDK